MISRSRRNWRSDEMSAAQQRFHLLAKGGERMRKLVALARETLRGRGNRDRERPAEHVEHRDADRADALGMRADIVGEVSAPRRFDLAKQPPGVGEGVFGV